MGNSNQQLTDRPMTKTIIITTNKIETFNDGQALYIPMDLTDHYRTSPSYIAAYQTLIKQLPPTQTNPTPCIVEIADWHDLQQIFNGYTRQHIYRLLNKLHDDGWIEWHRHHGAKQNRIIINTKPKEQDHDDFS